MKVKDLMEELGRHQPDDIVVGDIRIVKADTKTGGGFAPEFSEEEITWATELIMAEQKASVSLLQRRFRWGYGRACRVMEELERRKVVGPSNGAEPREVFV